MSPNDLWVRLMKSIHGEHFYHTSTNGTWASLVDSRKNLVDNNLLPHNFIHLVVGNGRSTNFWNDIWCGNAPLASRYNRLFHLDSSRLDTVTQKWDNGEWRLSWSREVIGGCNNSLLSRLLTDLQQITLSNSEDKWVSSLSSDGLFSVKSTCAHIDKQILPTQHVYMTWIKQIPRKVNVFLWRFKLDALPIRWNLSAKVADDVWRSIRVWLNCNMPNFHAWEEVHSWIEALQVNTNASTRIKVVVVTVLWVLWRFRNGVAFNDIVIRRCNMFDVIQFFSFRWLKNRGQAISNWNSWLQTPL
ncbi:uncharacterized protein [Rutidosis leptorrhynchoides]|uniref:uncharacterized protein n=1 Tax=Rutidosis leptorrhynchoides TaxID=125765 RepID=UPI003A99B618